jgi:putative DNA primase/helicase
LPIAPQLAIKAVAPSCGKTTFLDTTAHLVRRPLAASSLTAAVVYRVVDDVRPSLMLDECDVLLRKGRHPELVAILRSAHRRRDAVVWRSVPTPDGDWTVKPFSAWCTYAYTAVGDVEEALQSRAIAIVLQRAKPAELKQVRPLEDGTSQALLDCGRKLARWAQDQVTLPDNIAIPETVEFRDRDNWRPLLRIAALAGPRWFQRACTAAITINGTTVALGDVVPFLADVRETFATKDRLSTRELIDGMLAIEEPSADWSRINRGMPIDAYYFRDRLKGLIDPPEHERRWKTKANKPVRGYLRKHFEDAFERYLPPNNHNPDVQPSTDNVSPESTYNTNSSSTSGIETKTQPISNTYDSNPVPDDAKPHPESIRHHAVPHPVQPENIQPEVKKPSNEPVNGPDGGAIWSKEPGT